MRVGGGGGGRLHPPFPGSHEAVGIVQMMKAAQYIPSYDLVKHSQVSLTIF